jgi:predicted HAD superfamily Cof-like phosphohydrolase
MRSKLEQVTEFYNAFGQGLPSTESKPSLTNDLIRDRIGLKMSLIAEEFIELVEAVYGGQSGSTLADAWKKAQKEDEGNRDVVEASDALADLLVVIYGMALEANIPLDRVFDEVHSSNMSKLGEDGKPILSDGVNSDKPVGKIIKGPNFRKPDISRVLDETASLHQNQLTLF